MLRELGHQAFIVQPGRAPRCDVLLALHARKSAAAVSSARELHPGTRVIVALTGTDLYRDIRVDAKARRSLELADRLVVLHGGAAAELTRRLRPKVRLVPQSAPLPPGRPRPRRRWFEVSVVAHLRPEKDPLRTALAARRLSADSRVKVVHAGAALSRRMRQDAVAEMRANPRYRWLGELPRWKARQLIARGRVLCITSEMEGGANVLSEAVAAGTPVIASRLPAVCAVLGADYPALFTFGDTRTLAALLERAERDEKFLDDLRRRCLAARPALSPSREKAALRALISELA
jgi:putative glycosyltransferase (TIGR04348 family)